MPVLVALLRGVNVGAHKRIKMEPLRDLFKRLGFESSRTYLQSGNVVFHSSERSLSSLAKRIEEGIEETFSFHSDVILRSASELRQVVAANPFAARSDIDASKLLVVFLNKAPLPEAVEALHALPRGSEELVALGREVYIYYPDGMGRSKLTGVSIDKVLKARGTGRNWNSVTNILALMLA